MADQKQFEIKRETYYKALLPNGRKAELRNDVLTVWTRAGEELVFGSQDVEAMKAMFLLMDRERAENSAQKS